MFLELLNFLHVERHTHNGEEKRHTFTTTRWTHNYMVQISSESRQLHSKTKNTLFLENVNFQNYACSMRQMTY